MHKFLKSLIAQRKRLIDRKSRKIEIDDEIIVVECVNCRKAVRELRDATNSDMHMCDECRSKVTFDPTDCLPGTEDKVKVMMKRANLRLPLFHPQDAANSMR